MKGYACVQGPKKKVLSIARDTYWCKIIAAASLDYEAIYGIAGSEHHVGAVLKKHGARVVKIDFDLKDRSAR